MTNQRFFIFGYIVLGLGMLIAAFLEIKICIMNKSSGIGLFQVISFIIALSPYIIMGIVLRKYSYWSNFTLVLECIVITVVSSLGVYLTVHTLYIEKDAQAAIFLGMIPFIQIVVYVFFILIVVLITRFIK